MTEVDAQWVLDSRGNPTVRVSLATAGGARGWAMVPSGASTGEHEALELRDGDPARFGGKGVSTAVANVRGALAEAVIGVSVEDQQEVDRRLVDADGTQDKSRLGANAVLGVSLATARARAQLLGAPLYRALSAEFGDPLLPVPLLNVVNGGAHADNTVEVQEFMLVPSGLPSFSESLRAGAEVYQVLKAILRKRGLATAVGDEGGFAPNLSSDVEALELLVQAIESAGYRPGEDVFLALDVAANELAQDDGYRLGPEHGNLTAREVVEVYRDWSRRFPLVSIEDGFSEDDWESWRNVTRELGASLQLVGDDLFVTNPGRLRRGIETGAANAILIKLNQIGTLTETLEAIRVAGAAGYGYIISHRSGETEDPFIADLAVATGAGQIKTGAPCRSERTAKYNRLLEIEVELGAGAAFAGAAAFKRGGRAADGRES
ncbi:MAG: phosphopyruvate hydratase [Gemmatimonadetes bacterium]|nr:phosphopyruvate hydratase [Gemmatimonadota bacterium]